MAIISYDYFSTKLNNYIQHDDDFFYTLVETALRYPMRYTGIFRATNAPTKIIQNVTQSNEIKFGYFLEDIVTEYIAQMGYTNLDKTIGTGPDGNNLEADQVFEQNNTVYLIEQKIRDDHDSTKKRGQYENFKKKYDLLQSLNPTKKIIAVMWFIDGNITKNKNYYLQMVKSDNANNIDKHILYGGELFEKIFNRIDVWDEICQHLTQNKSQRSRDTLSVPDFDNSPEILNVLHQIKKTKPKLIEKLFSTDPIYVQLRRELFPDDINTRRLRGIPTD